MLIRILKIKIKSLLKFWRIILFNVQIIYFENSRLICEKGVESLFNYLIYGNIPANDEKRQNNLNFKSKQFIFKPTGIMYNRNLTWFNCGTTSFGNKP